MTDIPVNLLANHDYAFVYIQLDLATIELLDPSGNVLIVGSQSGGDWIGTEFRAKYAATYTIRLINAQRSGAEVVPDCKGNAQTLCHISVNHTQSGQISWDSDSDWRAVRLLAGRDYHIECVTIDYNYTSPCTDRVVTTIHDVNGKALSNDAIHITKTGTYYLDTWAENVDEGWDYRISLRVGSK